MTRSSAVVVIPAKSRRPFRLWIPFLLIWILLLPFVLLLAPLIFVACLVVGVGPLRGVSAYWQLFKALRGLRVEVADAGARIRIV